MVLSCSFRRLMNVFYFLIVEVAKNSVSKTNIILILPTFNQSENYGLDDVS